MVKRFIKYYKPHLGLFTFDMLCCFVASVCTLFYPVITRNIINKYIPSRQLNMIVIWCIALIGIYLLRYFLNFSMQYWGHVVGVRMQADMRREIFQKLQRLPFSYFDDNKTGVIMSRIVNDLQEVSELAHHGPEMLFTSLLIIIGCFIIMAGMNIKLTLIIFAFIPFLVWFAMKKRLSMSKAFTDSRVKVGEVNATLENSIGGIRVSKAFTNKDYELKKFDVNNNLLKKAREHAYKVMGQFFGGTTFITDFLNAVVLLAGGYFTFTGQINYGDFVAYLLFVNLFITPIRNLTMLMEQFQEGMTGFKRFTDIMDVEEENDSDDATEIKDVKGKIEFREVGFSYEDDKKTILNHINFKVKAGETLAFVGPSGGGKTTLCNLIPRFYNVTEGSILIDERDINKITLESLRNSIGIVQQDVFLFTGTIYENILYGRPDATREEVELAAKRASIHDFILEQSNGYETYIGERGIKLSGGQKQRISIARVFLKNPPILILDEATSALDNTTEILIQKSLEELCKGRTTLVVAHRLSTIKNADEIIVLSANGIEEQGSHEELMSHDGIYSELYNTQFKDR